MRWLIFLFTSACWNSYKSVGKILCASFHIYWNNWKYAVCMCLMFQRLKLGCLKRKSWFYVISDFSQNWDCLTFFKVLNPVSHLKISITNFFSFSCLQDLLSKALFTWMFCFKSSFLNCTCNAITIYLCVYFPIWQNKNLLLWQVLFLLWL